MSITEQRMGWGSWRFSLDPSTTPAHIWAVLDPDPAASPTGGFGHILITPTRVNPEQVGDTGMKAIARYTGIYRGNPGRSELSGVGLVAWLGDEDDKGDIFETAQTGVFAGETNQSFAAWVKDLLPAAITAGTITAIAGTFTESVNYMTPRAALARVMDYFAGEFRINPDGTLDAGTAANLFQTTPNTILIWRGSGPGGAAYGYRGKTIEVARDLDDYSTRVLLLGEGSGGTIVVGAANAGPVPYKDLHGNTVVRKRIVNAPEVATANANTLAAAQLGRFDQLRRAYRLATDEWGVGILRRGGLEPGDTIWVYDPRPDAQLRDAANEVTFNGELLNPIALRLHAWTWPIQEGMGAYFRYYDASTARYVDLSPHVVWETGDTTFDVGAPARRIAPPTQASAIQSRLNP